MVELEPPVVFGAERSTSRSEKMAECLPDLGGRKLSCRFSLPDSDAGGRGGPPPQEKQRRPEERRRWYNPRRGRGFLAAGVAQIAGRRGGATSPAAMGAPEFPQMDPRNWSIGW
jgi:hypothetical protein